MKSAEYLPLGSAIKFWTILSNAEIAYDETWKAQCYTLTKTWYQLSLIEEEDENWPPHK